MPTILFITVGGSPAPIVTAINSLRPDRVIFICSAGPRGSLSQIVGEGTPCEVRKGTEVIDRLPNIPNQVNLGDRFNADQDIVLLDDPDDLSEGYQHITYKIREIKQNTPDARLYADYTGGTKTMSLALGAAALDQGITLYLTTSAVRENLFRVERGESTGRASTTLVTVERTLNQELPRFLEQYNYAGAIAALTTLLANYELSTEQRRRVQALRDICSGFDAWDRFNHLEAWNLLSLKMKQVQDHGLGLKRVLSSREAIDPDFVAPESIPGSGYEIVEDLLLNAERRAHQQSFDDAVGRLYRALELLAQVRLKHGYRIQSGDVDLTQLPEALREHYEKERNPRNGKIQLALWKSYILLSQFPSDPLGKLFEQESKHLLNALEVRNHSLFAHGFKPITESDYLASGAVIKDFIKAGLAAIAPQKYSPLPQFPTTLK
ncbi:MAG: TIGR02710 family CRISPR-associated CARF protein [Elainellaceae cyanobacterium]